MMEDETKVFDLRWSIDGISAGICILYSLDELTRKPSIAYDRA